MSDASWLTITRLSTQSSNTFKKNPQPLYTFHSKTAHISVSNRPQQSSICSCGLLSKWLPVTCSIIQGSDNGPSLYLVYTMDLKTVSSFNKIVKYADDTVQVSEYSSFLRWIWKYSLVYCQQTRDKYGQDQRDCFQTPWFSAALPGIEQIISTKLSGIYLTATLFAAAHVNTIWLFSQWVPAPLWFNKISGFITRGQFIIWGPTLIFTSIIQSVITYALPSFAGQLSKSDKSKIPRLTLSSVKLSNAVYATCLLTLKNLL